MNISQVKAAVRWGMALGGGGIVGAALHVDPTALGNTVQSSTSWGQMLIGLVPMIVSGVWGQYAHTIQASVDRAVTLTGGPTSPLAPAAPAAISQGKNK